MRAGIITTGGTVAGSVVDGVVHGADTEPETSRWVRAAAGGCEVILRHPVRMMSENMEPADWVTIAQAVRTLVADHRPDGIVVLHGTDTMSYSASALAFLCGDLDCPIVVTGSNVPATAPDTDATRNLSGALAAVRALDRGCVISFAGDPAAESHVMAATRARKVTSGGASFHSIGAPLLGTVAPDGTWAPGTVALPPACAPDAVHVAVDPRVALFQLHPGLDFEGLQRVVEAAQLRAVVLQLFPSLTAPTRAGRFDCPGFTAWATERGVMVVGCPTTPGRSASRPYESTLALRDAGMEIVPTALPEVAYVKAAWAAAAEPTIEGLRERFLRPVDLEFFDGDPINGSPSSPS